jgi:MFS family permease
MSIIAMMAMALEFTGTEASWGYLLATQAIAYVALGPIAGRVADKVDRRVIACAADLTRTSIFIGMTQVDSAMSLYILGFLAAAAAAFWEPATRAQMVAILPERDLLSANALIETANGIISIFGMVAAGTLLAAIGWNGLLSITAACFLWCAVMVMTIRPDSDRSQDQNAEDLAEELKLREKYAGVTGGTYLRQARELHYPFVIRTIMLVVSGLVGPLLIGLVMQRQWGGAGETAYLIAAIGVGSLIASRALSRRKSLPLRTPARLGALLTANAAAILVIANTPNYALALCVTLMLGVTETVLRVHAATELQRLVPTPVAGRVFATMSAVHEPIRVFAFTIAAMMMTTIAADHSLTVVAVITFISVAALFIWSPSILEGVAEDEAAPALAIHAWGADAGAFVDAAPVPVVSELPTPSHRPAEPTPAEPAPLALPELIPAPQFVAPQLPGAFTRRPFTDPVPTRPVAPRRPFQPSHVSRLTVPNSMVLSPSAAAPPPTFHAPTVPSFEQPTFVPVGPMPATPFSSGLDRAVDEGDLARSS